MPRRAKRRAPSLPGLYWRGEVAYWRGQLPAAAGGDRITKSLGTKDPATAHQYAGVVQTFMDRGDWTALRRWKAGELHIGDLARAVREGDYTRLRRISAEGPVLGAESDRFLERTAATLSEKSYATYHSAMNLLLAELGRDYPMHELTVRGAEEFLHAPKATARGEVWSARSQKGARIIYGALWQAAIEHEAEEAEKRGILPVLTRNPWKRARTPKLRQTRVEYLSPEEWSALVRHPEVEDTPAAALLGVAVLAGLREDEILHLRPSIDVDLAAGVLHIQPREGEHAWRPKHDHSIRDVPIVPALGRIIRRHIELGFSGDRFLIRTAGRDQPIGARTSDAWTRRAFEAAGVRYGRKADALTLHNCRHTFASWMALASVPFHVIADLMGNTPEVVMRTYAHLAPSDRERAMKAIEEATE